MKDKEMTEVLDKYSGYYVDVLDNTYDCVERNLKSSVSAAFAVRFSSGYTHPENLLGMY